MSVTQPTLYVYRNGLCIYRSSQPVIDGRVTLDEYAGTLEIGLPGDPDYRVWPMLYRWAEDNSCTISKPLRVGPHPNGVRACLIEPHGWWPRWRNRAYGQHVHRQV